MGNRFTAPVQGDVLWFALRIGSIPPHVNVHGTHPDRQGRTRRSSGKVYLQPRYGNRHGLVAGAQAPARR